MAKKRLCKEMFKTARKKAAAPTVAYEPWLIEHLKDPAEAAAYIEAAIEDGDQPALMMALRHEAQAQGGILKIATKRFTSP